MVCSVDHKVSTSLCDPHIQASCGSKYNQKQFLILKEGYINMNRDELLLQITLNTPDIFGTLERC